MTVKNLRDDKDVEHVFTAQTSPAPEPALVDQRPWCMRRYENVPCCLNNGRGLCCNRPAIASMCAATCAAISPTPDCTCAAAEEAEACAASLRPGNISAQLLLLQGSEEEDE